MLLLALLLAQDVGTVPPPPHWKRFVLLVWQYRTDVIRDRTLYESVNLRGFHVDRENARLTAFGRESGWPFYVDHAAGKGILHLGRPVARREQRDRERSRDERRGKEAGHPDHDGTPVQRAIRGT